MGGSSPVIKPRDCPPPHPKQIGSTPHAGPNQSRPAGVGSYQRPCNAPETPSGAIDMQGQHMQHVQYTNVPSLKIGDRVRIYENKDVVSALQVQHGGWQSEMAVVLGKVGKVVKIDSDGDVAVTFGNKSWVFNPACFEAAPGERIDELEDDRNERGGSGRRGYRMYGGDGDTGSGEATGGAGARAGGNASGFQLHSILLDCPPPYSEQIGSTPHAGPNQYTSAGAYQSPPVGVGSYQPSYNAPETPGGVIDRHGQHMQHVQYTNSTSLANADDMDGDLRARILKISSAIIVIVIILFLILFMI